MRHAQRAYQREEEKHLPCHHTKERVHIQAVVVVEHDMEFVRRLNCKVTVLHEGSVLAEGSIDQVQANPRVIEVYLGR